MPSSMKLNWILCNSSCSIHQVVTDHKRSHVPATSRAHNGFDIDVNASKVKLYVGTERGGGRNAHSDNRPSHKTPPRRGARSVRNGPRDGATSTMTASRSNCFLLSLKPPQTTTPKHATLAQYTHHKLNCKFKWNRCFKRDINKIESVQRRFTKRLNRVV